MNTIVVSIHYYYLKLELILFMCFLECSNPNFEYTVSLDMVGFLIDFSGPGISSAPDGAELLSTIGSGVR